LLCYGQFYVKQRNEEEKMKNKTIAFVLFGLIIILNGCALFTPPTWVNANTTIVKNEKGEIIKSEYTRTVRGFSNNDPETASLWANADRRARATNQEDLTKNRTVDLPIRNTTKDYAVIVNSPPFHGLQLGPGDMSNYSVPIPVGVYPLTYTWYKIGSDSHGTKTVYINIAENRTRPITIGR
jgi:hypothetical protein